LPAECAEVDRRWLLLLLRVGGGVGEHMDGSLLVGGVQKSPDPVYGDRCRTAAKTGATRQHRSAAATSPVRVDPINLLVVQIGDEHVTGNAVD